MYCTLNRPLDKAHKVFIEWLVHMYCVHERLRKAFLRSEVVGNGLGSMSPNISPNGVRRPR